MPTSPSRLSRALTTVLVAALLVSIASPVLAAERRPSRKAAALALAGQGSPLSTVTPRPPVRDQTPVGHVRGTARDASGTPIPGVAVGAVDARYVAEGADRVTLTRSDGTFELSIPSGVAYYVIASGDVTFGQFYDHAGRVKYAKTVTVKAGRTVSGVDFALTRKTVVDASSVLTTAVVGTESRPRVVSIPRVGGDRVLWREDATELLRMKTLGGSAETTVAVSEDAMWSSTEDANSRYSFHGGSMTDLATGITTQAVPAGYVFGVGCDERWACFSIVDFKPGYTGYTTKIVALDLDTGARRTFDFGTSGAVVGRGSVADGHAAVTVQTIVSVRGRPTQRQVVRMLDLVHGTVARGSMPVADPDAYATSGGHVFPFAGKFVYLNERTGALVLSAPDGSWSRDLVPPNRRASRYGLVGDGRRVMWAEVAYSSSLRRPVVTGSSLRTLDLHTHQLATVVSFGPRGLSDYDVPMADQFDVSGDRFVWAVPAPADEMDWQYGSSGEAIRTATVSDLPATERVDDPQFASSHPGKPLVTDTKLAWVDDRGYAEESLRIDLMAKPLAGGAESVVATDVRFSDSWAPAALSGDRVAYAKRRAGSPWAPVGVDIYVTDLTTTETTRVATGRGEFDYDVSGPDWTLFTDNDLTASGDWVYYVDDPAPVPGSRVRSVIKGVNATTGESRLVATSNQWRGLGRLVPAGGGRLIYFEPVESAVQRALVYDPATRRTVAASPALGLVNRPFAAEYPRVVSVGLSTTEWWDYEFDGPLTVGSLADGSNRVLDPYAMMPWSWDDFSTVLAVSGDIAVMPDRLVNVASGSYYDLGLQPAGATRWPPVSTYFASTGGSVRGDAFAVGYVRADQAREDRVIKVGAVSGLESGSTTTAP